MKNRILWACVCGLLSAACGGSSAETDTSGSAGGQAGAGGTGAGSSSGAGGAAGAPAVCTSQKYWTGKDMGSELMHPGGTCLACHATNRDAPKYAVAGTVYPTYHEPDDCNGINGIAGTTVVITDANGKQLPAIQVNGVGNFHYQGNIAAPFHVKVVAGGQERAMSASPPTGDCNSCHTTDGANSAPGRILAP